jgi:DNA-binding transcriptional regulator YiaG
MHNIEAIEIPEAEIIRSLRQQIGTQEKCANMAQVSIKTWQCWEDGTRNPSKSSWGMFLLAIDQHPDFVIFRRNVDV